MYAQILVEGLLAAHDRLRMENTCQCLFKVEIVGFVTERSWPPWRTIGGDRPNLQNHFQPTQDNKSGECDGLSSKLSTRFSQGIAVILILSMKSKSSEQAQLENKATDCRLRTYPLTVWKEIGKANRSEQM